MKLPNTGTEVEAFMIVDLWPYVLPALQWDMELCTTPKALKPSLLIALDSR